MSKIFNITDQTALFDRKVFHITVDDVPGVSTTEIIRVYNSVADPQRSILNPDMTHLTNDSFAGGDTIMVQWDESGSHYTLLKIRAAVATSSKILTNGFSVAGYTSSNNGDMADDTAPFVIPGGLQVGFGSYGDRTEPIMSAGGIEVGTRDPKVTFEQLLYRELSVGAPFSDVGFTGYFGYGGYLNPFVKDADAVAGDSVYDSESGVSGASIFFNGVDTILGGVTQSEYSDGDLAVIDLINDDLTSLVGRFEAELTDNNGALNWKVINLNVQALIVSTNYTAGVVTSFNNSLSLGNKAFIKKNDQIVLGTTGVAGEILTDYNIVTNANITAQQLSITTLNLTNLSIPGVATFEFSVHNETAVFNELADFNNDISAQNIGCWKVTGAKGFSFTDVISGDYTFVLNSSGIVAKFDGSNLLLLAEDVIELGSSGLETIVNGSATVTEALKLSAYPHTRDDVVTNNYPRNKLATSATGALLSIPDRQEVVLDSGSFSSQVPSGTDSLLQVEFGGVSDNDDVQLLAGGDIIFKRAGSYTIVLHAQYGRTGSSGISELFFALESQTPLTSATWLPFSYYARLDDANTNIPWSLTVPLALPDTVDFPYTMRGYMWRDSVGNNSGSLEPHTPTLSGPPASPSMSVLVVKN